jgi:LmbE family N-acetylglucosaminyl deacetylase
LTERSAKYRCKRAMNALAVMAHPDDIEFTCAGTLALLKRAGWNIFLATMTPGDVGSMRLSREAISEIRRAEAAASAAILGAGYACLEFDDLAIVYGAEAKRRVCGLIRQQRPDLIIAPASVDYMADHEETSRIVREAAFASTVPNFALGSGVKPAPPCEKIPAILCADPIGLCNSEGKLVRAGQAVDISSVIDIKEKMLAAHESQRSWLKAQHGEDEYILSMKRWSAQRARDFKRKAVRYAEGFRRHLGHGFPKQDCLTEALGSKLVRNFR